MDRLWSNFGTFKVFFFLWFRFNQFTKFQFGVVNFFLFFVRNFFFFFPLISDKVRVFYLLSHPISHFFDIDFLITFDSLFDGAADKRVLFEPLNMPCHPNSYLVTATVGRANVHIRDYSIIRGEWARSSRIDRFLTNRCLRMLEQHLVIEHGMGCLVVGLYGHDSAHFVVF